MTTNSFPVGSKVSFLPGAKSTSRASGTVKAVTTSGEGRGKSTFLVVTCTDGKERKARPGSCTAA